MSKSKVPSKSESVTDAQIEKDQNSMTFQDAQSAYIDAEVELAEMFCDYTGRFSLEEAFALADDKEKTGTGDIKILSHDESLRELTELVNRQQSLIREFTPE